jgi:hypothetical protein
MKFVLSRLLVAAVVVFSTVAAQAQSMTARDVLEKAGLLAIFSIDCSQRPAASNGYIVYRPLDTSRVQRDTMVGQTDRMFVSVAETASFSGLNEITINGTADGKPISYVLRVEGPRHRVMQWTEDGKKTVTDGVWTEANYTMPWVSKCG